MKKSSVGKSEGRTPGKHELLNALLGKQVAASAYLPWMSPPFTIIDLCAGDGRDTLESGNCSPKIIMKHTSYGRNRQNVVKVIMVEKDPNTFDALRNAYEDQGCTIINGDSSTDEVTEQIEGILSGIGPKSPVFIHHDPNAVTNWCLRAEHLDLSSYVTTMVTMGCNVSGIKRLNLEERLTWFDNFNLLKSQVKSTKGRLDLCLIALIHDCSNWAYAVSVPSRWRVDTTKAIHSAFKSWPKGIELEWMRTNPERFEDLQNRLFLTKDEYNQRGGLS
jgi:hypothetical protein